MVIIKKWLILLVFILLISVLNINSSYALLETTNYNTAIIKVNDTAINLSVQPVDIKGSVLVPAKEVFNRLGINVDWYPGSTRIKMYSKGLSLSMRIGDRSIIVNGVRKRMDAPPVMVDGKVMVPLKNVATNLKVQISTEGNVISLENEYKRMKIVEGNVAIPFVVVVDAGHGGKDPGAIYNGVKEKDLNLDIAIRLNQLLKAEGVKTYMTRVDDRFIGLYDRSALANKVKADLLISVHNNAAGSTRTSGSMSLYYPGGGNTNRGLTASNFASIVQKGLTDRLSTFDHGEISRPGLAVLRTAKMPAVIAEVGYMSNAGELKKLMDPDYRQKAAVGLKNAILKALDKI